MKETCCTRTGHQVQWDGRTVWVNSCKTGANLARFTKLRIDIHTENGEGCLACHNCTGRLDWETFKTLIRELHNVIVPDDAEPTWGLSPILKPAHRSDCPKP